jgi:hypothetical protein
VAHAWRDANAAKSTSNRPATRIVPSSSVRQLLDET